MTSVDTLHLDLVAAGVVAAGIACAARRWVPTSPADLGVALVGLVLAARDQIPELAAAAIVVLAVASAVPRHLRWALSALAGLALLVARSGLDPELRVVLALALVIALIPPQPPDPLRGGWLRTIVLPAAMVATFLGGPDTEAAIAWGTVSAIVLAGIVVVPAKGPAPLATWGAVAFAAADAYRGRPARVGAVIVVAGALAAVRLVQLKSDPRKQMSRNSLRAPIPLPATCAMLCGAMVVAARTLGLATTITPREAAGTVALAVGLAVIGAFSETPVPSSR